MRLRWVPGAGLCRAAVGVVNPHIGRRIGGARRFDGDDLLGTHPHVNVADPDDLIPFRNPPAVSAVEEHEMVAQPVHLDEGSQEGLVHGRWKAEVIGNRHHPSRVRAARLVNLRDACPGRAEAGLTPLVKAWSMHAKQ